MRFVLGGKDTEMETIESLLKKHGVDYVYATHNEQRVNRSEAYNAHAPDIQVGDVWVETRPEGFSVRELFSLGIDVIDHHSEGDPGFARPFSEYWEASSLGQVCVKLGIQPTERLRYIAAADHCLLGAYHGQCPGVDRNDFLKFRLSYYESEDDPMAKLKRLHKEALACPTVQIGDSTVYDITEIANYSRGWFNDMACYYNMKTISRLVKPNRTKLFVSNLSGKDIDYFMNEYVKTLGKVVKVYGDPKRQFAAAVIEHAD